MKLHELATDESTKIDVPVDPTEKDPCALVAAPRHDGIRILQPHELRPLPRRIGFLGPHREAHGDKIVTEHGSYHVVPVIDEHSGTIVRRRMYEDGHLGAVEQY